MIVRMVLATGLVIATLNGLAAHASEPVRLTFDLSSRGKTITNKFGDINVWEFDKIWLDTAARHPDDYFRKNFPFVERLQFICATGGNEKRDLFKDPKDRTTLTDYDFSKLITACDNAVAKGLKPLIKTGWVPLKLSAPPEIGRYFTNRRPPEDYDAYYAYIKAIAEALKQRFGIEELKTWSWGVGTELESGSWFHTADANPESSKRAFCKLYDYSIAALVDALGQENLTVGAHSTGAGKGRWDVRDFIEHCARGTNYKTGKPGTKLDYLAISYYTHRPGFDPALFAAHVNTIRDKARQVGLTELRYGFDEGRVMNGWDGRFLNLNEVQHLVQAASDARLFHSMVDLDVDYYSFWCLTTDYITESVPLKNRITLFNCFGGIPAVSANLRNLTFRMAGSQLLDAKRSGKPADAENDVNGLAGFDARQRVLRVLVYNFNPVQNASVTETVSIDVEHVRPSGEGDLKVRSWRLDADHGNWWKLWQADVATRNMGPEAFVGSVFTLALPGDLTQRGDVAFWHSREEEYRKAGELKCDEAPLTPRSDGRLKLQARLQPYGVTLFEIFPVEADSRP